MTYPQGGRLEVLLLLGIQRSVLFGMQYTSQILFKSCSEVFHLIPSMAYDLASNLWPTFFLFFCSRFFKEFVVDNNIINTNNLIETRVFHHFLIGGLGVARRIGFLMRHFSMVLSDMQMIVFGYEGLNCSSQKQKLKKPNKR